MSFSALGLFGGLALTGAGIAGVAGWSAWLAAAGLTLLGLVGMKEAILWRWRREQERTKLRAIAEALAGERDNARRAIASERDNTGRAIAEALAGERDNTGRAIAEALAGERDNTGRAIAEALAGERDNTGRAIAEALAGERDNTGRAIAEALAGERDNTGRAIAEALADEHDNTGRAIAEALAGERDNARLAIAEVLAGERDNTGRAIAEALAGERDNTKRAIADERERAERALAGALAQERSGRSLVDVHLADRGLPLRRVLLLFTMHRSGSTWLFDMLRTHPAIRVEPTTRAWTALGIDGWRYPGAFHHVQGASMPLEVAPGLGAAIPVFPRADVPDTTDVREADRWALEKAYPQFVGFEASRLAARVRNLRENGLEIEIVYGVRCPLDAMWSMVEYKNRNSQWDKTLPVGEVPRFFARSLEVLAEVRALLGGSVIEYETLPNSAVLNRLGRRLDSAWHEAAARAWLAHAASATERSRRAQRPNAGFLGERNRSRDQAGPDGAWRDESDAVAAARDAHRRLVADERPS